MPIETKFICLEEPALYELIDQVIGRIKEKNSIKEDIWISSDEAMQKLRISSRSTLQNLRDNGSIRFTQPTPKYILYDANSINEYLNKYAHKTF